MEDRYSIVICMEDYREIARQREYRRRKKRQKEIALRLTIVVVAILLIISFIVAVRRETKRREAIAMAEALEETVKEKYNNIRPDMDVQLLTINENSRPALALEEVHGIVIHYTANPGTTAQQNRDYFESLKDTKETSVSSHFVIGLEGEIIQCIPCSEEAYASNDRNFDTLAIECCIAEESGEFNAKTYDSLIQLTTWLMGRYDLTTEDVIRHYDVTGKNCPKYFVENQKAWENFKGDLRRYIEENGVEKNAEF